MTCETFIYKLQGQIGESWDGEELEIGADMQTHARSCQACSVRLAAARVLRGPDPGVVTPPADLESRILQGLPSRSTRIGRTRWMPLAAAAAMLVILTAAITVAVMRPKMGDGVEVRLILVAPGARQVAVVGDWNDWDPLAQPLDDSDGDGTWELRFRVEPGRDYEYQFVVDEAEWISDPDALLQVDDGFGGTNSILDI